MSKTYKGYELVKAIADGEIKEKSKFIINGGQFDTFYAYYKDKNIKVYMFGKEAILGIEYLSENCNFELIEDEIDIEPINAYKLIETSYLAGKLEDCEFDLFMEQLKQSELEIVGKINKLIDKVKQLDKKINEKQ